jgi:hypothetical protein
MTATDLVRQLHARGVVLVPDGDTLRCRPKSALSPEDLAALKAMKAEVIATLTSRPSVQQTAALKCFSCKGHQFWRSTYGVVICATCHPAPCPEVVAAWVGPAS